jgi:tape measure domain-containing protein
MAAKLEIDASTQKAISEFAKLVKKINATHDAMKKLGTAAPSSSLDRLSRSTKKTTYHISNMGTKLADLKTKSRGIDVLTSKMGALGKSFSKATSLTSIFSIALGNVVANFVSMIGVNILGFMRSFSNMAVEMVTATVGFKAALSGVHQSMNRYANDSIALAAGNKYAGESMEFVKKLAFKLGQEFGPLATSFRRFTTSALLVGQPANKINDAFKQLTETLTVLHVGAAGTSRAFLALEQMFSKGKVMSEELRRQFGDVVPGAFQVMAETVGVTSRQLDKMLRDGAIGVEYVLPFIQKLSEKFEKGLAIAIQSPIVAMGRFKNSMEQLSLAAGEGFLNSITSGLNNIATALQGKGIIGSMKALAGVVGIVSGALLHLAGITLRVGNALLYFTTLGGKLVDLFRFLGDGANYLFKAMKEGLKNIIGETAFNALAASFKSMADSLSAFGNALEDQKTNLGYFYDVMKGILSLAFSTWLLKVTTGFNILKFSIKNAGLAIAFVQRSFVALRGAVIGLELLSMTTNVKGLSYAMKALSFVGLKVVGVLRVLGATIAFFSGGVGLAIALTAAAAAAIALVVAGRKADKELKILQSRQKSLDKQFDEGIITAREYQDALNTLSKTKVKLPNIITPTLGDFNLPDSEMKKFSNDLESVLTLLGVGEKDMDSFVKKYGGLILANERLGDSFSNIKNRMKEQLKMLERIGEASQRYILQLQLQMQQLDKTSVAYKTKEKELQVSKNFFDSITSKKRTLKIELANFGDTKRKTKELDNQIKRMSEEEIKIRMSLDANNIDASMRAIDERLVNKGIKIPASLDVKESDKQIKPTVDTSLIQNSMHKLFNWMRSGFSNSAKNSQDSLTTATEKTASVFSSVRSTGTIAMNDISSATKKLQSEVVALNNIPLVDKTATYTIIKKEISSSNSNSSLTSSPSYAIGTANTSNQQSTLPGGGFNAILHKNEAVVPLSHGRTIPVEIRQAPQTQAFNDNRVSNGNVQNDTKVQLNFNVYAEDVNSFNRSKNQIMADLDRNIKRSVRRLSQ